MPSASNYQSNVCFDLTATIANGQTTSAEIDLAGCALVGIHMPAAFTGTTLTFTAASASGGTFNTVYKDGANLSITVTTSKYVVLNPQDFCGIRFLKVVSGSSEGADRVLTLAARPV